MHVQQHYGYTVMVISSPYVGKKRCMIAHSKVKGLQSTEVLSRNVARRLEKAVHHASPHWEPIHPRNGVWKM